MSTKRTSAEILSTAKANKAGISQNKPVNKTGTVAEYWCNIGVIYEDNVTGEEKFLSLGGFSLDDKLVLEKSNSQYAKIKNSYFSKFSQIVEQLTPGKTALIPLSANNGHALQIRRIGEAESASDFDEATADELTANVFANVKFS